MRTVTWQGRREVRVETRVMSTGICGSDHAMPLEDAPKAYAMFQDGMVKTLLEP
ncbi:hypothetical protein [Streptomyces sp. NPDC001222]|uniref:hypothetical protein n=1 Tax=Streptomyces sp. NPDC001222 TaxID=3364548 RepID=UPI003680BB62